MSCSISWKISSRRKDITRRKMLQVERLHRQTEFVGNCNGLPFDRIIRQSRAMLNFQLLRPSQWHFQAVGQIVRYMIASHCQHAGMLDDPISVHSVIGCASANVNHQRAHLLLLVRQ